MKGVLQKMLVSLIGTACSLSAVAVYPEINMASVRSHYYPEFIVQESHIIEDGMNNLKNRVIAPQPRRSRLPCRQRSMTYLSIGQNWNPVSIIPGIVWWQKNRFMLTGIRNMYMTVLTREMP